MAEYYFMSFEQSFDSRGNEEIFFPGARTEEPCFAAFKVRVHNPWMCHQLAYSGLEHAADSPNYFFVHES
jgi:hypothetical protein